MNDCIYWLIDWQVNGSCRCPAGYSGSRCEVPCASDRYGVNCVHVCSCNSSLCDPVTGACQCSAGWQGQTCNIPCPGGLWGNCSNICTCVHGSCDPSTGNCTCERGWQGALCDQSCSNCGSPCKCYHGNGSCDASSGMCYCFAGYQGSSCLEACPTGYYGNNCKSKCLCSNGSLCNNVDGSCDCAPGWTGPQCKQGEWQPFQNVVFKKKKQLKTDAQYMEYKLVIFCSISLSSISTNYHSVLTGCPSGKFGRGCTQACSCIGGSCDPISGFCSCDPGYHGDRCDTPCPLGTFGKDCQSKCRCMNGSVCGHVSGKCTCAVGWRGRLCDVTCARGFYGRNCSERWIG